MRALLLLAFALLAACRAEEPENVQARAANASVALEQLYNKIEAEAQNGTAESAAPLENEADALLNQLNGGQLNGAQPDGAAPAETNAAGNAH
ncbi:MAG: hypothetical protein JOZ90_08690 [Alphaproteobacteria bacterium]|nr:hypothetical protein [Alphaproteobacteria bacterium]MBV9370309.1 hypothetical protein [Alphaproteobacteria bacterium]MBV9901161.1 hypothetical protein [Alphaproteobacteria bacterium]